jgi:hypothetical protein
MAWHNEETAGSQGRIFYKAAAGGIPEGIHMAEKVYRYPKTSMENGQWRIARDSPLTIHDIKLKKHPM